MATTNNLVMPYYVKKVINPTSRVNNRYFAQGYGVKLDGLGIFYPSILNKKGGTATAEEFNAAQHIKGVLGRSMQKVPQVSRKLFTHLSPLISHLYMTCRDAS